MLLKKKCQLHHNDAEFPHFQKPTQNRDVCCKNIQSLLANELWFKSSLNHCHFPSHEKSLTDHFLNICVFKCELTPDQINAFKSQSEIH